MRARSALLVVGAFALALPLLASCNETVADLGLDANLQVDGAQFHRGSLPTDEAGPAVKSVNLSPLVHPGAADRQCSGVVDPSGTAVALALDGDPGYWILPAGPPDVTAPGSPTFATTVSFSAAIGGGSHTFFARAVDAAGHFGPSLARTLDVAVAARPTGHLVIALTWENHADLDLHVVDPNGVEIWRRNINSYEPPPPGSSPEPPGTPHPGGILDFDSNAQCVPDGRYAENVVYTGKPPSGHYIARVDTFSLCDEVSAHWRVEGFVDGVSVGAAEGTSTQYDTRFSHDRGAGVLALELDIP